MKKAKQVILTILTVLLLLSFPAVANAAEECTYKEDCAADTHNEECLALLIQQLPDVSGALDTKYYYYNQLSDVEKVMYWKFSAVTAQAPLVAVYGLNGAVQEEVFSSARMAYAALISDSPEYHMQWNRWLLDYTISPETGIFTAKVTPMEGSSAYLVSKAEACIDLIVRTVGMEGDLYSRARDLMDLLCNEMEYDLYYPFSNNRKPNYNDSALGCLVYNTAVCAGFSDTVKILCDALEIPCIVVGNAGHAWNFIRLDDGLWYSVDASWATDEQFLGKNSSGYINNSNFHIGDMYIVSVGDFSFPTLSDDSYIYPGDYTASYHEAVSAFNEPDPTFVYQKNADGVTCTITAYEGPQSGDLVIPESVDGLTVTAIGVEAFYGCHGFTGDLILPDTVITIGAGAFQQCHSLSGTLQLPAAVESIGASAFLGNSNLSGMLDFPETLHTLEAFAFYRCSGLTGDIVLPAGITIGTEVFSFCAGLDGTLYLPDDFIWSGNILSGTSISAIQVNDSNTNYASYDGMLFSKDMKTLLACAGGRTGDLVVPEGVETISGIALYQCENLKGTLTLPESLKTIEEFAFYGTNFIGNLIIPDAVVTIGKCAFLGTTFDGELTLPSSLTRIEEDTFLGQSFSGLLILPSTIEYVGEEAFHNNDFTKVVISSGVDCVENNAFSHCEYIEELIIGNDVSSLGKQAFQYCWDLSTIIFEGNAPQIAEDCFMGVTATVYYPADNTTWTEDVMQSYGGTLTWVAQGEAEEERLTFTGASVSLGNSLDMNFFLNPSGWDESIYAVITRTYADGRKNHVLTIPGSQWTALDSSLVYITYPNIAAKEMGDTVSLVICDAEGNAISEVWEDSIKAYAMRMLEKETDTELLTVLVDMLNYGAAAQTQFGYNTANLVNADLTDTQQGYATDSYETESNLVPGIGRYATTLTLKSRITLDFIFRNSAIGEDYTGLYAVYTYQDHYGDTVETRVNSIKAFNANCGYVSVPGLAVADYGQPVTCTVYDAEGNMLAWTTDSIEGYAHRMAGNLPQMVDAIVKFGISAYHYFH